MFHACIYIDAGAIKRFNQVNTTWGIDQLLSLKCFKDASNGFFNNDSCTIGVEVFVIEQKQSVSNSLFFKIENFTKLDHKEHYHIQFPSQTVVGYKGYVVFL